MAAADEIALSAEERQRLRPPAAVVRIARTLADAGFETWCVGGAVRDALLGIPHLDWDLATAATPAEVRRLFRRTVPLGIEFGTVGVLDDEGRMHEVTTFRRDVRTDGRHAEVEFGASLEQDLARRDFTINAIAYHPQRRVLRDPFDGRGDLARGVVRAVGVADERMREDRLRALRAIRFAARFEFEIEPATWSAIVDSAPHMRRLSAERVKQELDKTFEQVRRAGGALRRWRDAGALAVLVPALAAVGDETLAALDRLPRAVGPRAAGRRVVRYATLFADVPERELAGALAALRFSKSEARAVRHLVALWQGTGEEIERALRAGAAHGATLRRWVARAGRTTTGDLLRLAAARWAARCAAGAPAPPAAEVRALYRRALRVAYGGSPLALGDLAIGGDDLRAIGVRPGPAMARLLHRLLDTVLDDPSLNRVDALLALARRLAAEGDDDRHRGPTGGA
ncbi:MAG TPA: CCA tRNA nucleotidyltransferase [Gemmatimonadaceae bacterium]|nr:CCA tRNA nucleotidyltransferase [Gemmatimonadaceae bacterium]